MVLSNITLFSVKPPMVYMWTAQRLEYEGNDVQLFCRASDRRNVKITWFDRDEAKIVNDSNYKVTANIIVCRCYCYLAIISYIPCSSTIIAIGSGRIVCAVFVKLMLEQLNYLCEIKVFHVCNSDRSTKSLKATSETMNVAGAEATVGLQFVGPKTCKRTFSHGTVSFKLTMYISRNNYDRILLNVPIARQA